MMHGTPVYRLAVQIKQLSWSAKRTTSVPWFLLQNYNVKIGSNNYTTPPLAASNTLSVTAVTNHGARGSS